MTKFERIAAEADGAKVKYVHRYYWKPYRGGIYSFCGHASLNVAPVYCDESNLKFMAFIGIIPPIPPNQMAKTLKQMNTTKPR